MKNTNIHVRLRHDRQPRLGVGRVTWTGHLEPANQHAPSEKKGTYQGKVEKPANAQVWKKPAKVWANKITLQTCNQSA